MAAAGEMVIEKGVVKTVTDGSGHYRPSLNIVKKNILGELSGRYYFSTGKNVESEINLIMVFKIKNMEDRLILDVIHAAV